MDIGKTLERPEQPKNIPQESQWLAGEGAGSWFYIQTINNTYCVTRFSPEGKIECDGKFKCLSAGFSIYQPYQFTYLSHCQMVSIKQGNTVFVFERISE